MREKEDFRCCGKRASVEPTALEASTIPPGSCEAGLKPLRRVHLRWMIRADMEEVLAIERGSYSDPWDKTEFVNCLRQRVVIGKVAVCPMVDRVVGFVIYDLRPKRIHILNLAVAAGLRRQQIGRQIIDDLKSRLGVGASRRNRLVVDVADANLRAHLFYKAMGFRAVEVLRDRFRDSNGVYSDAYRFVYRS